MAYIYNAKYDALLPNRGTGDNGIRLNVYGDLLTEKEFKTTLVSDLCYNTFHCYISEVNTINYHRLRMKEGLCLTVGDKHGAIFLPSFPKKLACTFESFVNDRKMLSGEG